MKEIPDGEFHNTFDFIYHLSEFDFDFDRPWLKVNSKQKLDKDCCWYDFSPLLPKNG